MVKSNKTRKIRQKGGGISARDDGQIVGMNSTGNADADLLKYLGVRWFMGLAGGRSTPDLISFYSKPTNLVPGFNMSLQQALHRRGARMPGQSQQDVRQLLYRILTARYNDSVKVRRGAPDDTADVIAARCLYSL